MTLHRLIPVDLEEGCTPRIVDFALVNIDRDPLPIRPMRDAHGNVLSMTRKQLRKRLQRHHRPYANKPPEEAKHLYKPIEQWDAEELARGRPRAANGTFAGRRPAWITREVHEEAMSRFRTLVKDKANEATIEALEVVKMVMTNEKKDRRGRPLVNASTKLDAAKFLIEHVIGKPTQHTETDISVRLQGILASAIVTPGSYTLPAEPDAKALMPAEIIDVEAWEDDYSDD